jgi:hypothetical protein
MGVLKLPEVINVHLCSQCRYGVIGVSFLNRFFLLLRTHSCVFDDG